MDISRRGFLIGTLAVSALSALPIAALPRPPKLWGDGIHDDTEALNALFAGEPVEYDDALVSVREGGHVRFSGGHTFRISGTVNLPGSSVMVDHGASFDVSDAINRGVTPFAARHGARINRVA